MFKQLSFPLTFIIREKGVLISLIVYGESFDVSTKIKSITYYSIILNMITLSSQSI